MTTTVETPTVPYSLAAYDRSATWWIDWANNDTLDVLPTVDLQIESLRDEYLGRMSQQYGIWHSDFLTVGDTKEWISALMGYKATRLLPVGTKVRVKPGGGYGAHDLSHAFSSTETVEVITAPSLGHSRYGYVVECRSAGGLTQYLRICDVEPFTSESPDPKDERIAELERQLAVSRMRHAEDIETIGERLTREARERSWCSEYDTVVDDLNQVLSVSLPDRTREYEVTFTVRARMTTLVTRTIEAHSAEDARDMAECDLDGTDDGEWDIESWEVTDTDVS